MRVCTFFLVSIDKELKHDHSNPTKNGDAFPGPTRTPKFCSNAEARPVRKESFHGLLTHDIPTGKPLEYPMGTVKLGYPDTAACHELPPRRLSPFMRSIDQGAELVGITKAQRS